MVTGQRERLFLYPANYPYFPFLCLSICVGNRARMFSPLFPFFPLSRPLSQNGWDGERGPICKSGRWASSFSFPSWSSAPQNTNIFLPQTRLGDCLFLFPKRTHDENQTEIHTFHLFKCVKVFDTFLLEKGTVCRKQVSLVFCSLALLCRFCMGDIECVIVKKE